MVVRMTLHKSPCSEFPTKWILGPSPRMTSVGVAPENQDTTRRGSYSSPSRVSAMRWSTTAVSASSREAPAVSAVLKAGEWRSALVPFGGDAAGARDFVLAVERLGVLGDEPASPPAARRRARARPCRSRTASRRRRSAAPASGFPRAGTPDTCASSGCAAQADASGRGIIERAIASPSSSRVHTSVMRSSSVGKRAEGRRSHQILVASSITPAFTSTSTVRAYSSQPAKRPGRPVRGSSCEMASRQLLRPVSSPSQNGEEVEEHEEMRQEVAQLIHQVDAQLVVLDADVDVHAAHDEAAADAGEIVGELVIALLLRVALAGGSANGCVETAIGARPCAAASRAMVERRWRELGARLGYGGARAGADLDLGAQELRAYLGAELCLHCAIRAGGASATRSRAGAIDEVVFLLDAEGEFWLGERHGCHAWHAWAGEAMAGGSRCPAFFFFFFFFSACATRYIMMPASFPPSTVMAAPVTNVDWSEHRQTMASAISDGGATLFVGVLGDDCLQFPCVEPLAHGRVERAGAEQVHPDAFVGILQCGALRQADQGVLGRDIGGHSGYGAQRGRRSDIDDRAAAQSHHCLELVFRGRRKPRSSLCR